MVKFVNYYNRNVFKDENSFIDNIHMCSDAPVRV